MSNSKLISYTKLSPNHSGKRTMAIDRITPHCVVGQASVEGLGVVFSQAGGVGPNYGIGSDGRIGLYVDEGNRSWCSSSNANDQRAVTIECASDATAPYAFNSKVYASLVKLCVDICKRNGKTKLLWLGDKDKTLNYAPKSGEMVLTVHRWFANKSCVPVDSEVLTREGWVKLSDINIGDEIACADLDKLKITFEEVYDKVPERYQDTYTNNGFTATKDHRCVYGTQSNKNYRVDTYNQLLSNGTQIYIPLAGYAENEGWNITDSELRLLVAVQADGHYMHEPRSERDPYIGLEFHLKKERKITRIKQLLEDCHIDYNENPKADGSVSIRIWGSGIVEECERYLTGKCFNWNWLDLSPHQAEVFLNEILLWDGCVNANNYNSRQEVNLDVVSAIAAINGVGSNVTGSSIQFRGSPFCTLGKDENSTKRNSRQNRTSKTRVSCVSVKTGLFLVSQNGKTFITGNCPGDWMYSRMGALATEVTKQLTPKTTEVKYKVNSAKLNIRKGPSTKYDIVGRITDKGIYSVTQVKKVGCQTWGKLKSGAGWICLSIEYAVQK